jgi:predicted permease
MNGSLFQYLGFKPYVFLVLWGVLVAVSVWVAFATWRPKLRRRIFLALVILGSILFLADTPTKALYLSGPVIIVIAVLNLTLHKFCYACGNFVKWNFERLRQCPYCAAELKT